MTKGLKPVIKANHNLTRYRSMTIRYTLWADPLLDYINNDLTVTTGGASSPFAPINYNADLYANEAKFSPVILVLMAIWGFRV